MWVTDTFTVIGMMAGWPPMGCPQLTKLKGGGGGGGYYEKWPSLLGGIMLRDE